MNLVTLHSDKTAKGIELAVLGDLTALAAWASVLANAEPDDEDYGINYTDKETYSNTRFTQEERDEDVKRLLKIASGDLNWQEIFNQIPKKKNGTFAKGRVLKLWRGETFRHYWEDSYGFNAPEIRIKVHSDDTRAVLEYTSTVESY